ncbi:cytochrome ubiquinol oxidase subunit I [Ammonicoccus fulvus]|uniref:Cytochrome ubiquinol oxidase subunit I n=1 Tax=Ammonicoccus fulvus TaxID=3138240 RepID=A0ABZ3FLZ1_9ACTN
MDVLSAARLEFALTAAVHYAFVATTLGLTPVIAALSFFGLRSGRDGLIDRLAATQLARLYLLNYAIGIVSGLVMELQLGLNWTGAGSAYDPIGSLVASETLLAFFIESTLVGLWLASAGTWSDRVRAWLMAGIAATAWLSAIFIICANAYLHRPVGFGPDGSLTDPIALFTNPSALAAIPHVASAAGITGGFWIAATGATLLLRHRTAVRLAIDEAPVEVLLGRRLLRIAVPMVAIAAPLTLAFGVLQFSVARTPGFTPAPSFFGVFLALMMFGGFGIWVVTWLVTLPLLAFRRLHRARFLLRLMVAFAPFPLVFNVAGWVYREENRQPWFIVNRVLVSDALSATSASGVLITGTAFLLIGVTAALVTWRLMYRAMASPPTERLGVRLGQDSNSDSSDDSDDRDDLLELAR